MAQSTLRTFGYYATRKAPTFAQAINWNTMMQEPIKDFLAKHASNGQAVDNMALVELWEGLVTSGNRKQCSTVMPSCVDLTIPIDHTLILRSTAGATAAFAFCEIAKQLRQLATPELRDDFLVKQAMAKAWEEFDLRVQEANDIQEGFGCDDSQSWHTLRDIGDDPKSDNLLPKMQAIAKLAGRLHDSFEYQRKDQPNEDPEEVVGATIGGDIRRIMSSELAMLSIPEAADQAAMKIIGKRAQIKEMRGIESKCRGPLVLVRDESGSMHDGDLDHWMAPSTNRWAGRNTWASACCVALARIAWAEDRAVICVHFGKGVVVQEIPKDDHRAMFEMARSFLSGGTSIGGALKRARAAVGDLEAQGFKGADIVIITDGCDWDVDFHNREIDYMDRDGVRLWTVGIGVDIDEDEPIRSRAEKYTYAHDRVLSNPDTAVELAGGLNKAAEGNDPRDLLN